MNDTSEAKVPANTQSKSLPDPSSAVLEGTAGPVRAAVFRKRHIVLLLTFLSLVLAPTAYSVYYLFEKASDQYSSRVSFSIRSEQIQNPLDALAGLGQIATGSSSDASILNEYLRSQKLVEDILENIDLPTLYATRGEDWIFSFDTDKPIEDLVEYFQWMNPVTFDSANGLLDIESYAFAAEDAQIVATAIMDESRELVERLSAIAQEDTTRLARLELDEAVLQLEEARKALGELRRRSQIVDPRTDMESQLGVLTALQSQLAEALIGYDLLLSTTRANDPRLANSLASIDAIRARIDEERRKVSQVTVDGGESLATVVGEFESMMANREFAEQAFLAARVSYDAALAEARRKSKYLAAHIPPTVAQSSQYPNRPLWIFSIFAGTLLIWSILALTTYAVFDRR